MNEKYNNEPNRIWKRPSTPYRSLVFWGWNNKNEPSFLVLYGVQNFLEEDSYTERGYERFQNVLCDEVLYRTYVLYEGMNGHLPSFQSIRIINHEDKDLSVYSKKGTKYACWWRVEARKPYLIKNQHKLTKEISIPYFEEFTYEELVERILEQNIQFENFTFAKNPNEVIKLNEDLKDYYELLCILMSDKNLNTRRKKLKELLNSNSDERIYDYILNLGSVELLSGLFLEAGKRNITLFKEKAESILKEDIDYANKPYMEGLKRCINIYLNSLNEEKLAKRKEWIYNNISEVDLKVDSIYNRKVDDNEIIDGARYRSLFMDSIYYAYSISFKNSKFFSSNKFQVQAFKNMLQESEIYNMPDIIGKIAYYIDAPKLHYYFSNNRLSKISKYFKSYIRRILFDYAENNEQNFMQAMKILLTSYTEHDFLCKFKGNFQFNYFIRNILYYNFNEKPPIVYYDYENHSYYNYENGNPVNYNERYMWMKNDQLLALEGRYEIRPEIWDNNLDVVLYIASNCKVQSIAKACYFILKDEKNVNRINEYLTNENLIKLSLSSYEPLANMFREILDNKLCNQSEFNFDVMLQLMKVDNEYFNSLAVKYLRDTNGHIAPNQVVDFILNLDLEKYSEFITLNISRIKTDEYVDFIKALVEANDLFKKNSFKASQTMKDQLFLLVNTINNMTQEQKLELLMFILNCILEKGTMETFIEEFLEENIFAFSYDEIKSILKDFEFNYKNPISSKNSMIINLINSIVEDKIPSDSAIINILETGMSKTLQILFELVDKNEKDILNRYSTLLILLECDIVILNQKVQQIFDKMDKDYQHKLLKIIIDSPVEKVYNFAMDRIKIIYEDYIPSDLVMQMMEHTSEKVKGYILNKSDNILNTLGKGDEDLFIHYAKTLLLLPNKIRKNKDSVYNALYEFSVKYKNNYNNCEEMENDYLKIEQLLLDMGNSNIINDKEKALVTLAKIKNYKQTLIGEVL